MIPILATSIAISLALSALLCVGSMRLRRQLRELRQRHKTLQNAALRYQWHEWWTRNAAEMTRADPARRYLIALAHAAQLAPDLEIFERDCDHIAFDLELPTGLRNAAKSFVEELRAPRLPWEVWAETTGKPAHVAAAIELAYREALGVLTHPSERIRNPPSAPPAP